MSTMYLGWDNGHLLDNTALSQNKTWIPQQPLSENGGNSFQRAWNSSFQSRTVLDTVSAGRLTGLPSVTVQSFPGEARSLALLQPQ